MNSRVSGQCVYTIYSKQFEIVFPLMSRTTIYVHVNVFFFFFYFFFFFFFSFANMLT